MQISEEQTQDGLIVAISGSIDTTTSADLRNYISKIPEDTKKVTMDFRDILYISSAGLREILMCRQRFPGDRLSIINVSPDIYDIFKTTGFHAMIPMEVTYDDVATYINLSFKDFLKKKAETTPDAPAVIDKTGTYTWSDMETYSQIIAADLDAKGVGKGTHVAICSENSANWLLTFYAIQKLGGMAQLLNNSMGPSEIATVAEIGDITHFCYGRMPSAKDDAEFIEEIKQTGCPIKEFISIKEEDIHVRDRVDEYEEIKDKFSIQVRGDDPCVMIFTSGSTGRPKGVLLSAYNILNASSVMCKKQQLKDVDKTCLILPLFHIFGLVPGVFANALAGSVIYIPKDIRTDTLLSLVEKERCTVFHSVPTMLIALMNNKAFTSDKLSSIRCTIIAGAPATEAQIKMFKEKLPNDHFMAAYGLSEMAPVSMTEYDGTEERLLNTVGYPVDNISIKILNAETGEDCPTGVSGEILVQGFNLMIGYYKVDVEDSAIDIDGWLHTGDLGWLDDEGYLHLSGRLKELIIRGGENIMPGEVESAVSQLSIVDDVKVLGVPSDFFGEEVAACIKLKAGAEFDLDSVKAELLESLAKFKVPSHFLIYDEFPMLGTGKIDGVSLKKDAIERVKNGE